MARKTERTKTSAFGVSKRESHDSSDFYRRFTPPKISTDETINPCPVKDQLLCGDSRQMKEIPDNCIALVATSPPYFCGKEYEREIEKEGIPATYIEYLEMLKGVFSECRRVLEPGGRVAINVANLGRRPYRSLSSDVIRILQDDLGFLLRGEIIWLKRKTASGNCAWGSWRSASNPCLRDNTERVIVASKDEADGSDRIIVASKGRFGKAVRKAKRRELGLPHEDTITRDDFLEASSDIWRIPEERATGIGHPAPFPVELPRRLIEFYTYKGEVVLDPFMGAGSTAIAAMRTGRHFVGYDLKKEYVELAEKRIEEERKLLSERKTGSDGDGERRPVTQEGLRRLTEAGVLELMERAVG